MLWKRYFAFCLMVLTGLYGLGAFSAFLHEWGHVVCAQLMGQSIAKISLGQGPVLVSLGNLQIRAWLLGGSTFLLPAGLSKIQLALVVLAGSLIIGVVSGLFAWYAQNAQATQKQMARWLALYFACSALSNLLPLGYCDGTLLCRLLGTASWWGLILLVGPLLFGLGWFLLKESWQLLRQVWPFLMESSPKAA